ncbi:SKP1-like protein 21 [Turnera subulata]|uniref:SKP1-like protein 21 n=1 Tax=Turnera subulata TaxID=218843 RepID=A0A9Q0J0G2_9ROSI|nr:SKP1-like protein 21 [Turnera subulata]
MSNAGFAVAKSEVNPAILGLILDYCRFHQVPGRSNKEHKTFDEKFIRMDTGRLCELTSAADSLQLKPLVDLTSRALARIIEGKTPEEIRETFHIPDDLTENVEVEEEPVDERSVDDLLSFINSADGGM